MLTDATTPRRLAVPAPFWGDRWHKAVLVAVSLLLVVAYAPTFVYLFRAWCDLPEYSHGFLMPPIAAYVAWERRATFLALAPRPSLVGVLLLVPCLLLLLIGEMDFLVTLRPYTFVGALAAVLWALYGWRAVRPALPILLVLALMCPLPGPVERGLTYPLTRIASLLATGLLDVTGIPATLDGNMIHLPGLDRLWVADACSGIRSLISLASLAILACLFWNRNWTLRLAVVLASIPIAVFTNGLRIWLTGFLSVHVSPDAAQGFFHTFEGFAMFAVAGLMLWVVAMLLGKLARVVRP